MSFRASFQAISTGLGGVPLGISFCSVRLSSRRSPCSRSCPQRPVPERDRDLGQDPFSPVWGIISMDWLRLCQSSPVPSSAPHTSLFTAIDRATSRDMQPITNVFLSGSCFSVVYYIYVTYRHIQLQANSRPSIDYRNNFRKHFVSCFSILAPSLHIQILDLSYCALLSNKPFMVNFSYLVTGEKKKR